MKKGRRQFLKAGVLGGIAAAAASVSTAGKALEKKSEHKSLNILVLGGTGFIGPHMVREALRRRHTVTLFNRGRTNNALFPDLETIIGDRGSDLSGLEGRQWDAVIDNSGYVPRHVRDSARLLSGNTGHYLYISTVAVYEDFSEPNHEGSALAQIEDKETEEVTGETYGPLKALCEQKAREEIGDESLAILRPTYICGPGDHTDRFSYWPIRTSKGGEMLWPGEPSRPMQVIDVRDLANFTIDCVARRIAGIYNTVTPRDSYSMGNLLEDSQAVTGVAVDPVWVDEPFIEKYDAGAKRGLPLFHAASGDSPQIFRTSGSSARAAGLHNRPIRETIRDLMSWWKSLPDERTSNPKSGLTADREAELIAAWKEEHA